MTLNEIASWLHNEYDIPYRKALSIAAHMIKEGAYNKPREEVEEIAKAKAGVEDITITGVDEGEDIFGVDIEEDESTARQELESRFEAIGMNYLGESGLLGVMAGALSELKEIALEDMSAADVIQRLNNAGFDDTYFTGLFEPSSGLWQYRNSRGKVKLYEWMSDVKQIMQTLDINASESVYYQALKTFL